MTDDPAAFDFTGNQARELQAEAAARVQADHAREIRDARARHRGAKVHYDPAVNDVVVDYTGARA